jgi:hypothetical protein
LKKPKYKPDLGKLPVPKEEDISEEELYEERLRDKTRLRRR